MCQGKSSPRRAKIIAHRTHRILHQRPCASPHRLPMSRQVRVKSDPSRALHGLDPLWQVATDASRLGSGKCGFCIIARLSMLCTSPNGASNVVADQQRKLSNRDIGIETFIFKKNKITIHVFFSF